MRNRLLAFCAIVFAFTLSLVDWNGVLRSTEPTVNRAIASAPNKLDDAGIRWIESKQSPDGAWRGKAIPSTILYNAHLIFLYEYLGLLPAKREQVDELMRTIWDRQEADGSFANYKGGQPNVSVSIIAYLAAAIAGEDPNAQPMRNLEAAIARLGGLKEADLSATPYLLLFGVDRRGYCANSVGLPALLNMEEKMPWFRVFLYPVFYLIASGQIHELPKNAAIGRLGRIGGCKGIPKPLQLAGVILGEKKFETWLMSHMSVDGTLFDYVPTTIPALMAISKLPGERSSLIRRGIQTIEDYQFRDDRGFLVTSPGEAGVAETSVIGTALLDLGANPDRPSLRKALDFIARTQNAEGAFGFSTSNRKFPDPHDTAIAIQFMKRMQDATGDRVHEEKIRKGLLWVLSKQNPDGGFGAWDSNKKLAASLQPLFQRVRRSGFVLNESIGDDTARIALALNDLRDIDLDDHPKAAQAREGALDRALSFLLTEQQPDGSFPGLWLVNYQYGTAQNLAAFSTRLERPELRAAVEKGIRFLKSKQLADGGFGESPASYWQSSYVPLGHSSPAQTGLVLSQLKTLSRALGPHPILDPLLRNGEAYLASKRNPEGVWLDRTWTAVSFPKMEFLVYPLLQEIQPLRGLLMDGGP